MTERSVPANSRTFAFKVNGVEIAVKQQTLTAREILQLASDKQAMPGQPNEYALQGDKGIYQPDAIVNLQEDNLFITIPTTPTKVASTQRVFPTG